MTAVELAVRFGKTLLIQEVDGVEPVLYPLLRGDLISQGPRFVVQIGEKMIDYNDEFRLFLTTRNPDPDIPPDAASVITEVNFTTTSAGLTGQVRGTSVGGRILDEVMEFVCRMTRITESGKAVNLSHYRNSLA